METFYAEVIADNRITIPKVVVTVLKLRKGQRLDRRGFYRARRYYYAYATAFVLFAMWLLVPLAI